MQNLSAVIIGATGLVGRELVQHLLNDPRFSRVVLLVRRRSGATHPKLIEQVINFELPSTWQHLVRGDVLFSALGTTLKQAGSKEAQYQVDFHYQYAAAKAAAENGIPIYVLVSAAMANSRSRIFYSRMKGELEDAVKKLPFTSVQILQPGLLTGNRKEKRLGEVLGEKLLRGLNVLGIAKKQRPVPAAVVAKAMVNAAFQPAPTPRTHTLLEVFRLAGEK
jgi:uncharacterized protein YbjT (DUF2867 family)